MSDRLSAVEKKKLLNIARQSIISYVSEQRVPDFDVADEGLQAKQGCFVTIKSQGRLRGCLGQFVSEIPLHKLIKEMAIAAATRDPRFYPMQPNDLEHFNLEISVLSPLRRIDTVEEIEIGKHGLYIEKNFYRGVLLPQVPVEYGWDRHTFLSQTCLKAGLGKDEWQDAADLYVFTADVFKEV